MKKTYQVYGIGSALVDFEFKVPSEQDWPTEIEKGATLLIDADMEAALLKQFSHLKPIKSCGGSGANTLSVISQLGGKVFYSCNVAEDADGNLYHRNLQEHGIASNLDTRPKMPGTTGKSMILISPDADRSLCTAQGASGLVALADVNETILANSQFLFVEIFLATSPTAKATALAAMQKARALNCKVALTLTTCKIPGFDKNHLYDMTEQKIDLLFCNALEAAYFCDSSDLNHILEKLKTKAAQFVMTRSEKPTLLYDGKHLLEVPTYPVSALDTTGAGDVFAGAFLQAIAAGFSFAAAGDIANFAAAKIITKYGTRLHAADINEIKFKQEQIA